MRTFSEGRLARTVAYLISVVFVWSVGLSSMATLPAAAQIVTRAAMSQSVAVVPFTNLSRVRPETLGDEAAAAVGVELRDRLLLDVLPKADVDLQMRDLGLVPPLSDLDLVRLATELDVALVVTGDVRNARIARDVGGRFAEVVLAVRLFDRIARVDVNGALVRAKSPASPDASAETLMEKALEQAAFDALQQMRARPTITAMVLWARRDTIFMNVGSRGGLEPGMRMVAIRGGERLAIVEVTDSDAIGSYAKIVEGPPLRTGDHLRAIYAMPGAVGEVTRAKAERKKSPFQALVLAAGLLFGFGSFGSRARLLEEGGIAAPRFATSNLANASALGEGGYVCSLLYLWCVLIPIGATISTWEPYSGTQKSRIAVYEVYRNNVLVWPPILVERWGDNVYRDGAIAPGYYEVTYTWDSATGALIGIEPETDLYIPEFDDDTGEWESDSWESFADGHSGDTGIFVEANSITYAVLFGPDISGPVAGQEYVYRVRPVILEQVQTAGGIYAWELSRTTEYTSTANRLVVVSAPGAYSYWWTFQGYSQGVYEIWDAVPNPEIIGSTATFRFYSPIGADEIIVQVARDPNFDFSPEGLYTQTVQVAYGYAFSANVDLTEVPGDGDLIWWRIGGRNRRSRVAPRPYPLDLTNDYGHVWSRQRGFTLTGVSREAMMHERRGDVMRSRATVPRAPRRATADRVLRAE
jgi:hypothetical protein